MRTVSLVFLALAFCPAPNGAADLVTMAGEADNFALPADAASPSTALASLAGVMQNFDLVAGVNGGLPDRQVAHTFTGLPSGIAAATLTLRVRAGNDAGVNTDGVLISFVDALSTAYCGQAVVWSRTFGPFAGGGCFPVPDLTGLAGSWSPGDTAFVTLDLSALPLAGGGSFDAIPQMNASGFIDVNVSDETGCDFMRLSMDTTVAIAVAPVSPVVGLRAPSPNPFSATTTFRFGLHSPAWVKLTLFDLSGRRVRDLVDGARPAGHGVVTWDGRDSRGRRLAPGVYVCVLGVDGSTMATRVVLLE